MAVHVSIHDVSPAWSDEVEDALRLCHSFGLRPALLVVPDFHGRAPLAGTPAFCERLRALQAEGHEIYLHGYLHKSQRRFDPASGRGRLAWLFAQRVVSGGEAEMSDVSAAEGERRIERGEAVLREVGLRIEGFVAPAWSMPRWLVPWLGARGYRFTEDHTRIYDPSGGRSRASVVLNWATRSPARLLSTVGFCRVARGARALVPARIAIHPGDMRFRLVRAEIEHHLAWAQGDFVARGADLLNA
jgi:predicted deacetylase